MHDQHFFAFLPLMPLLCLFFLLTITVLSNEFFFLSFIIHDLKHPSYLLHVINFTLIMPSLQIPSCLSIQHMVNMAVCFAT